MSTTFLQRQIHVLHLEDDARDQMLVDEMLRTDGLACEIKVVKTGDEFETALRAGKFDLIISDFSLPSYDGLNALTVARKISPHTPFIFFSGTIGEEVAVETLRSGATDYVLKQRPSRLLAAIRRALQNAQERARLQRVEGELRKVEDRLRIVARASDDVVWEWDIIAGKIWFSENFENVFGYAREKIGARPENWQELIHPDDRHRVVSGLVATLAGGGRIWWSEHRLRRAGGDYLRVYDRATVISDADGKPLRVVGMVIDMTEQKTAEEKIRDQATLLDKAQDAIIVLDVNGRIVYWNKGAERIYGWSREEAVGQSATKLLFHENPPPELQAAIKQVQERGEWVGELREFTKDGRQIIVQSRPTLIRDNQDQSRGVLIINTDITERKQLEEKFLRAQRLESLGALASGIAHDLNNALVPIVIGVEILGDEALSPDARSMIATMKASARRSTDMVQQMLLFARGGEAVKKTIHAGPLLKELARVINDTFPKNIQCRLALEKDLWPVSGYPTQLHQVLLNLCVNARDAMPRGGKLTLSAGNTNLTADEARRHSGARPGNYLCLAVADTGEGIAPEILDKIFQPFFTTKGVGKGTGLGLSTCHSIASGHDGFVTVQSKVGAGSEFKVYLPGASSDTPQTAVADLLPPPAGHGEHILVVDDEEAILAITRAALENYGYKIITAGSGPEAIGRFAQNADDIRLVICDLGMPLMDGETTAAALRKIRSDLKVIMTSGSEINLDRDLKQIKPDASISKPFTSETLLKSVHQVLQQTSRNNSRQSG